MNDEQLVSKMIGKNLKKLRVSKQLTQKELAEYAYLHRNDICNLENGRMNPTISIIHKLALVLGVEISTLMDF